LNQARPVRCLGDVSQIVAARVAELLAQAAEGAVMAAGEVLEELSKIGRANMADFIRAFACGDPVKAVDQLTAAQTAALCELTVEQSASCMPRAAHRSAP
jgi:hypothetical protein